MKSRFRVIGSIGLVAGVVSILAGCGKVPVGAPPTNSGTNSSASSSSSSSSSSQNITVAFPYQPDTLDPNVTGQAISGMIDRNIVDTLVWINAKGQPTPDLATKWTINSAKTVYTFTLRKGVKFQDGTPFNAAAVVFNINRIENPATKSQGAISDLGPFKSVKALSEYKVQITLKQPFAPLLTYLGTPNLGILSPTAVQKEGGQAMATKPVGTGPFEVAKWVPQQEVVLKRNPNYNWAPPALQHSGPAYLNTITFKFVQNAQNRVSALQTGEAQAIDTVPPTSFDSLKQNPNFTTYDTPYPGTPRYIAFNTSLWPTNDVKVRQALEYAVDRPGVIKVADSGVYSVAWGPLQKGTIGYNPSFTGMYAYNVNKATSILQQDGWSKLNGKWTKNGKTLSVSIYAISGVEDWTNIATAVQAYLQQFGVDAKVVALAEPAWYAAIMKGSADNMTATYFMGTDPDILRSLFTPGAFGNWSLYNDPTVTKELNQASQITSMSSRLAIYDKVQKTIMDQAVMMPIYNEGDLFATSKNLTGLTFDMSGYPVYLSAKMN
ncbi:ABC transporter substrate-binding protein [Alicyclobacillus mengziensis]|uniref:ABC transporter substrate-binding protein n=1 Tax=Alicyclobacillus mengziensis TaxID=2931921 RepID=A0A9X7Z875_9BACL|nr:ABC transporter substrate-binding protein [Alicyclobacillus mengziensis]QSO49322.1 ABC transporter substrate-binding protein [Alicyclobacillus mengziensis]